VVSICQLLKKINHYSARILLLDHIVARILLRSPFYSLHFRPIQFFHLIIHLPRRRQLNPTSHVIHLLMSTLDVVYPPIHIKQLAPSWALSHLPLIPYRRLQFNPFYHIIPHLTNLNNNSLLPFSLFLRTDLNMHSHHLLIQSLLPNLHTLLYHLHPRIYLSLLPHLDLITLIHSILLRLTLSSLCHQISHLLGNLLR
jgi:hypothetical protein